MRVASLLRMCFVFFNGVFLLVEVARLFFVLSVDVCLFRQLILVRLELVRYHQCLFTRASGFIFATKPGYFNSFYINIDVKYLSLEVADSF